jgi:ribosomal protein S18 acetylase RimI-like enzyme
MLDVRRVRATDVVELGRLLDELGYPTAEESVAERLAAIADREGAVFVAEQSGRVVGWIHVSGAASLQYGTFAEVTGLVISDAHRGEGLGTRLMVEAEAWASESGYAAVRLRSRSSRERTHAFYLGLGYSKVKEQVMFTKDL